MSAWPRCLYQAARTHPKLVSGDDRPTTPDAKTGYAYVTSQLGRRLTPDPREVALRDAVYSGVRVRERRAALTSGAS